MNQNTAKPASKNYTGNDDHTGMLNDAQKLGNMVKSDCPSHVTGESSQQGHQGCFILSGDLFGLLLMIPQNVTC